MTEGIEKISTVAYIVHAAIKSFFFLYYSIIYDHNNNI